VTSSPTGAYGSAQEAALDRLFAALADRHAPARAWAATGRPVVGYVGTEVPLELVMAAGALPVRITGWPPGDTSDVAVCGRAFDGTELHIAAKLLAGDHAPLDLVLVAHDCEASLQLFYLLRELRRRDPAGVPETHLVDLRHLPRPSTTAYNVVRLNQLVTLLEQRLGTTLTDDAIARSAERLDATRAQWQRLLALRVAPPRLTGTEAFAVVDAAGALPIDEYLPLLERVVAEVETRTPVPGHPAFLTGSAHDGPAVYETIETAGFVIVGEDHAGSTVFATPVGPAPTIERLAEWHRDRGPTTASATAAQRAAATAAAVRRTGAACLISYARTLDEAPAWDFGAQVAASGVPAAFVAGSEFGSIDLQPLRSLLRAQAG
jgi:benzoyl-CoA reductase/2-hydroxyglutaryl-CoA dehydratase subunit BcrC/BadD/HgdB